MKTKPSSASPSDVLALYDWNDCVLEVFEINLQEGVVISKFHFPADEYDLDRMVELTFIGILRVEVEWNILALKPPTNIMVRDVYCKTDDEWKRWQNRIDEAKNDSESIDGLKSMAIFHVVIEAGVFRGWGENSDLQGIQIVCRNIKSKELY